MKRLLTLALMVMAVMAYSTAYATINGSPHDYKRGTGASTSDYGQCGTCHVPHAALGAKRLWRVNATVNGTGNAWGASTVGSLCASCHFGGDIIGLHNINDDTPHPVGGTVYDATSHGRDTAVLVGALTGQRPAGDPYMTGLMECTSCHNVHFEGTFGSSDAKRPFLRGATVSSMSGFCGTCHNDRLNDNTLGAANTSGNHPVNIAYASAGGGAYFVDPATMSAALRRTVALNAWSLGGKFNSPLSAPTAASTIGCQTCHAIHNPGAGTDQGNHLLAINNVAANAALCEGCHGNPSGNTARANSGATMRVGAIGNDHPIDCAITTADGGPNIDRWYADNSTDRAERHTIVSDQWPTGTGGNIICTSCHSAHKATSGAKLIRTGSSNTFCTACHADPSPLGHHTHSGNTPAAPDTRHSYIDCSSCHGGSGFGGAGTGSLAHNSFTFNANFANSIATNEASQLCNFCHLQLNTPGGVVADSNTGNGGSDITRGIAVPALPADHLGAIAGGSSSAKKSHWLGTFTDGGTNPAAPGFNSINVKRTSWGSFGGFSKYGGATDTHGASSDSGTTLVCESCHSVLHNMGTGSGATQTSGYEKNLLLQEFVDDGHGATSTTSVGSGFCVACHNQTNVGNPVGAVADSVVAGAAAKNVVPAGTHPMTGWSITRAEDAGRTPSTLITGSGTYAAVGPGQGSYPATDAMDCDSCHRVHYAPDNSIYDQTKAGGTGNSRPVILETQGAANEWADFCQTCHSM